MNKTRNLLLTSTFLVLLSGTNCLKKQDYPPLEPIWPRYKFGGIVLDSIAKNTINGCIITVIPHQLVYSEDYFTGAADTTDSCGSFLFHSLPVGDYWVNFEREGYCSHTGMIMMYHRDSVAYRWTIIRMSDMPDIFVLPPGLNVNLNIGQATNRILYIYNQGDVFPLEWEIEESPHGVRWLTVDPERGSIPSHSRQSVDIKIDASEILEPGSYEIDILVISNDLDEPNIYVPLKVKVKKASDKPRIHEIESK